MSCQQSFELKEVAREDGSDQSTLPPVETDDYILVAKLSDPQEDDHLRTAFIQELEAKGLTVTRIKDDNNDIVFYGIRLPFKLFERYKLLLKVSDACNSSCDPKIEITTRIRIVHYIAHHTDIWTNVKGEIVIVTKNDKGEFVTKNDAGEFVTTNDAGVHQLNLRDLIKRNVFDAKFCLHEEEKQEKLREDWARWTAILKPQPITKIRNYFGEKVALYFLWLGWYTYLLVPAALIGVIVFLYGVAFFNTSPLIKEVCESKTVMCPLCDKRCKVWQLSDTCTYAKVNLLFDNEGTVFFAMFMAVWATVFLAFWKRYRATYLCKWKVSDWCEEEEELILDIVNDERCKPTKYKYSYLHSMVVLFCVTVMILVIVGLTSALVVFRVIAAVLFAEGSWQFLSDNSNTGAMLLGAFLHYIIITVMTRVNREVALKLCYIEENKTFSSLRRGFALNLFIFQFFTSFSSLIYVAFFLGRINGHPGGYVRITGKWRLQECHPSGCLTDLFIQMAMIMVLKQTTNNIFEFGYPWLQARLGTKKQQQRTPAHRHSKEDLESSLGEELCDNGKLNDAKLKEWLRNYSLVHVDSFTLFHEFLEMVLQFSFTTIFVAAFPLAPLLALINNIIEIRLDAIKMVTLRRRMTPNKTNDIGVWTGVLEAIGVLAVIANGLVIGVSSDFIPRQVYRYLYGPCANGTNTYTDCMSGYINNTLSVAWANDQNIHDFLPHQMVTSDGLKVTYCSFKDYRSNEDYSLTHQFWLVLAVRLAFVILFEHVVVICKFIADWFVPDAPMSVKNDRLEHKLKHLTAELSPSKDQSVTSRLGPDQVYSDLASPDFNRTEILPTKADVLD